MFVQGSDIKGTDIYRYLPISAKSLTSDKKIENIDFQRLLLSKVITKSKVGSLTLQPAKHDVTGMPLYRIYPIRFSTL